MKSAIPNELRQNFSELLHQLDGTGDEDRANCTRIFCLALLNELKSSDDRGQTLEFLNI
jgi:hypothetical protein